MAAPLASKTVPETLADPFGEDAPSARLCAADWGTGASGREPLSAPSAAVSCCANARAGATQSRKEAHAKRAWVKGYRPLFEARIQTREQVTVRGAVIDTNTR